MSGTRYLAEYLPSGPTGIDYPQAVAATSTVAATVTAKKNVGQAVAASTTVTPGVATRKSVGQVIAVTSTLTATLSRILGKFITIGVAVGTAPVVVADFTGPNHTDIVTVLPSLRQRSHVAGTNSTPVWTITLEAV